MKKNKKKTVSYRWGIVLTIVVAGVVSVSLWTMKEPITVEHSLRELQERYDYNLGHRSPTNIHPRLRAVYFSKGKYAAACGTMVIGKDGQPSFIVTASHLFSNTEPGSDLYDYHVLGPSGFTSQGHLSSVVLDSLRTSPTVEGIQDVALCYMGDASLISRTSAVLVSAASPSRQEFSLSPVTPFKVTSITTGESFEIIGEMVNTVTNAFYLMLYENMNGESGSGFLKQEKDMASNNVVKLYILSGDIEISAQTRRDLKVPAQYKRLTPMSAIEIKW
ncbi:MAG: hypothetical protein WCG02_00280 [Candidatus Taylorbacteria bacterium]